uniref:IF rod domain-containing protein n=1 Tax=Labrus bergylta TaxID=56723 RepID=A0A3Q3ED98_9LABR
MFGGAGGRGSRASVASLEGLRNILRNETEKDSAPPAPAPAAQPAAPAAPAAPADDKQTLRGLNDRLSGYLGRVRQLEKENGGLQKQIDDILAKRKTPAGRDWDKVEQPLDDLKKQVNLTLDNAKLLLQIDNTNLANDDFKEKLEDEKKDRKQLEKDLEDLKKTIEDTKMNVKQTQKEIDLVKEEIEVDVLREKIKDSEVTVEIDSLNSNLSEMLNKVRGQYEKLAKKNLKETDDWYQSKVRHPEAQTNEAFVTGKTELKDLLKQKQTLEIKIQSLHSMETLQSTKVEYGQRLGPLNKMILDLEKELKEVRAEVERLVETNKNLLCVKMKLEAEIDNYQQLIHGMTVEPER